MSALIHAWDLSIREAIDLQKKIAALVEREDRHPALRTIAGVDVAYGRRGKSATARGAAVLFDFETLNVVDQAAVEVATTFPYVPGLLTFREAPAAIAAVGALATVPDLLICDGQGIAHPRRCGVASHLGLVLDLPSIGAAKSRLIGSHEEPAADRGAWTSLVNEGEIVGACLRTRSNVSPIYVSIGHRICLSRAIRLVMRFSIGFRLPEPTRLADKLSRNPRSLTH